MVGRATISSMRRRPAALQYYIPYNTLHTTQRRLIKTNRRIIKYSFKQTNPKKNKSHGEIIVIITDREAIRYYNKTIVTAVSPVLTTIIVN